MASDLKSILMSADVMARYLLAKEKPRKYSKPINLESPMAFEVFIPKFCGCSIHVLCGLM